MRASYPEIKLYIGGEWADGAGGRGDDVVNPATEEVIGRVPFAEPSDVDAAIAAAIRCLNGPTEGSGDVSLCHGLLGSNELLLMVGERFGRSEAFAAAHQVGDLGIARFHQPRNPRACGVPDAGETPSMMLGTAGIGLHYLRLYDPSSSPSIVLPSAAMEREVSGVAPSFGLVRSANSRE